MSPGKHVVLDFIFADYWLGEKLRILENRTKKTRSGYVISK